MLQQEKRVEELQSSLMWSKFIEFLDAVAELTTLSGIHLSDNKFLSYLDTVVMKQRSFYGSDQISPEDLPEFQLLNEIFDAFELDQRLGDVIASMLRWRVHRSWVVDTTGRPIGVVAATDVIGCIYRAEFKAEAAALAQALAASVATAGIAW